MGERIKCCVPFCRRSADAAKFEGEEIICGKCWRSLVSVAARAERTRLKRRHRKIDRLMMRRAILQKPGIVVQAGRLEELSDRAWSRNWERCKTEAIGAAGGIR